MYLLPDLPYKYKDLEPHIDAETMKIHHGKHHAAYINNLNKALEGMDELLEKDINDLMTDLDQVPESIRETVRNNGGGHANHSLFWAIMSPDGGGEPNEKLLDAINDVFGSFDSFQTDFNAAGTTRFGSGWAWLVVGSNTLEIMSTPNQDSPLTEGKTPILGCDVWEHAYYLKYQNKRPDYMSAWWNTVNWNEVSKNYSKATS